MTPVIRNPLFVSNICISLKVMITTPTTKSIAIGKDKKLYPKVDKAIKLTNDKSYKSIERIR